MINQNSRTNERKSGHGLMTTLAGLALFGSIISVSYFQNRENERIIEEYAGLPVTNVTAEVGDSIARITGKFVDMEKYTQDIRYDQFTNDNLSVTSQRINNAQGYLSIRYDPKYLAEKQTRTH